MLLLESNGVVEEELRGVFGSIRDGVRGEILVEGTRDIGEQEGNIVGRALGEDGGQSGECRVGPISDAWDSAIGEYEDGSDRVGFLLNLSRNTFLGGLILRTTAIIDEPRSVEDANLRKRLPMLDTFIIGGTYHYAVGALEFINAGQFGLALVARTILLVGGLENFKVVVIHVVAVKYIGDEFQGRGLANTILPKKKNSVWRLFLRCYDDPLLEKRDVARKEGQN